MTLQQTQLNCEREFDPIMDDFQFQFSLAHVGFQLSAWDKDSKNSDDTPHRQSASEIDKCSSSSFGCSDTLASSSNIPLEDSISSSSSRKHVLDNGERHSFWKCQYDPSSTRKVRFSEHPEIHSFEKYDREDFSLLYYSVHELQKMIDECGKVEDVQKSIEFVV